MQAGLSLRDRLYLLDDGDQPWNHHAPAQPSFLMVTPARKTQRAGSIVAGCFGPVSVRTRHASTTATGMLTIVIREPSVMRACQNLPVC